MHYLFFLLPLLWILLFSCTSDSTWAPFQSDQVKEICSHMTAKERRRAVERGAVFGLNSGWVVWSYSILWNANWQTAFRFISNWCDNHSATGIDSHGYLILEIETTDRSIS